MTTSRGIADLRKMGQPPYRHPDAACRNRPPEVSEIEWSKWWFPERGQSLVEQKKICWEKCPVRLECLEYAIVNVEQHGIWGGTADRTRRRLRVERQNGKAA